MNKKSLQRLGVVCMAAAMVLTTVSFPRVAKAEGETSTQTDAATSTEQEAGKVLMQVDPTVLQARAMCNSQQDPHQGSDGLKEWAFDTENHWWHSRWTGTKPASEDTINATVRPWIGSGFGQAILLKKVTYQGRGGNANANNSIKNYSLYYADTPKTTLDSSDWILAERGSFTESSEAQEIVLDQAVRATHFKLVAESTLNWNNSQDKSTCAKNIKVYAEDTLNLTVTAPVNGNVLQNVTNEAFNETVATVVDQSKDPIDTPAVVNETGIFGEIANGKCGKLDVLTGKHPFMIRMKVKLNGVATTNHVLINRGNEPYQIAYGIDGSTPKIKFQMLGTNNTWYETKVNVTGKIGKEIEILALYTGASMGLWVDGERANYQKGTIDDNTDYTMKPGTGNALKIGDGDSPASIKSVQVVNEFGTLSTNAGYNNQVEPAFNQGTKLLDLQIVNTTRQHLYQYTLASEWKKGTDTAEEAVPAGENADGTKNYRAVVTATPTGSLKFTDEIMPKMLKVNVDGTHIKTVPITDAKLNDNGTMEVSYSFEKMFIGGSLRMDYATDYSKTCMRFGYDFKLPENAEFEGCEWYYGTAEDALNYTLLPQDKTNHIKNPEGNDPDVYRSNIVFTKLGSANYKNNVYARVLVKYTLNGKSYSKMGTSIDTRTVKEVADKITSPNSDASEEQKAYAQGILGTIPAE